MNNRDAYVLAHFSSDDPLTIDDEIRASPLLKQFDSILRERLGLELRIINLHSYAFEECKRLLETQGISSIMSTVRIQEGVIPRVTNGHHNHTIVDLLHDQLTRLFPVDEIIIVDNYIFPKISDTIEKRDYLQLFEDIFTPVVKNIKTIKFITLPKYNHDLYLEFKDLLLAMNPSLDVFCKMSDEFHDRFWIADRSKGLFIGTSLNGIGKRYALIDMVRDDDTAEILSILEKLNLI
jgi:hypothetical protein